NVRTASQIANPPPRLKSRPDTTNAQKYTSRPWPSGWRSSGGRRARRIPRNSSTSLPLSAIECSVSANIAALPVAAAATPFSSASATLPSSAATTARFESSAMRTRPSSRPTMNAALEAAERAQRHVDERGRAERDARLRQRHRGADRRRHQQRRGGRESLDVLLAALPPNDRPGAEKADAGDDGAQNAQRVRAHGRDELRTIVL